MEIHEYHTYQLDLLHQAGLTQILELKIMDHLPINSLFLYRVDAIILVCEYNLGKFCYNLVSGTLC